MKITFKKSFTILGLIKVNVGKQGFTSVSIGGRWVRLNVGRRGVYLSGSLVGTGLGFRKRLDKKKPKEAENDFRCSECKVGELLHTHISLTVDPPLYPHKCNQCDHTENLNRSNTKGHQRR